MRARFVIVGAVAALLLAVVISYVVAESASPPELGRVPGTGSPMASAPALACGEGERVTSQTHDVPASSSRTVDEVAEQWHADEGTDDMVLYQVTQDDPDEAKATTGQLSYLDQAHRVVGLVQLAKADSGGGWVASTSQICSG